ncbi:MAG: hypothetical protein ACRDRY_25360, partial [Pseudonocardiaceae bacterium]
MITTRPWPGISSPDWFINSDTPQVLVECEDYQRLVDGVPIEVVLDTFDVEVLEERDIPAGLLDEHGGLLPPAGYLSAAGVGAGAVIGIGLSADGLRVMVGMELPDRVEELAGLEHRLSVV